MPRRLVIYGRLAKAHADRDAALAEVARLRRTMDVRDATHRDVVLRLGESETAHRALQKRFAELEGAHVALVREHESGRLAGSIVAKVNGHPRSVNGEVGPVNAGPLPVDAASIPDPAPVVGPKPPKQHPIPPPGQTQATSSSRRWPGPLRRLLCSHPRTVLYSPRAVLYVDGQPKELYEMALLEACLDCGRVAARDA